MGIRHGVHGQYDESVDGYSPPSPFSGIPATAIPASAEKSPRKSPISGSLRAAIQDTRAYLSRISIACGLSPQSLYRFQQGNATLTSEHAEALARLLGLGLVCRLPRSVDDERSEDGSLRRQNEYDGQNGSWAEAVRNAIRQSGVSAYRLARNSGVQEASLSRFLSGKCRLRLDTIDRLAGCLSLELVKLGRAIV